MAWPFGLIRVSDSEIRFHSWHMSWWIRDQAVTRASIRAIKRFSPVPGATRFVIQRDNAEPMTVNSSGADGELLARELQLRGYVIHLSR
jgi:hypothetical protein